MESDLRTLPEDGIEIRGSIKVLPDAVPKRKAPQNNKSDLGVNFIAPDGGWGWLVVIAAAISILVTFAVLDQFDILFRRRFETLGLSSSQMAIIINAQHAAAMCTALLNGEIFRRFTFRKISLAGAIFTFFGLAQAALANSFTFYILSFSIMCGIGRSLIFSSSYIAINTYFDENRRAAIAWMYSIAGLGPILLPYLTTYLMNEYGVFWAILFYAALSLHNFACSLIYQPVKLHTKNQQDDFELTEILPLNLIFGSRHIKKLSDLENSTNSNNDLNNLHRLSPNQPYPLRVPKNSFASFEPISRSIPKIILPDETEYLESPQDVQELPEKNNKKFTILEKISIFLDLDLLKDFSYVTLALGLTLIYFVEINYALMMPFILIDFGCNESQIIKAMFVLALCDMLMRMAVPVVTRNLRCSNKIILLCALIGLFIGRTILLISRNFTIMLICFGWIGLCTAMRIVFWMLILPSYMPLKRLPAGIGLQQVATGLVMLTFGQFNGLIQDASNYSSVLLCLNTVYLCIVIAWLGESFLKRRRKIMIAAKK